MTKPADSGPVSACHNCRRQRRRWDLSVPHCKKCVRRGQECLGYGKLFLWQKGVASRGKMAGIRLGQVARRNEAVDISPVHNLVDPVFQDLSYQNREYLCYFSSRVCRELVLYDIPRHNRFLDLVPMARHHQVLLEMIIAMSALHTSNVSRSSTLSSSLKSPVGGLKPPRTSRQHRTPTIEAGRSYEDALAAKQRALSLLRCTLASPDPVDVDITLAVVLLFIQFELLDSGRDGWVHHMNGARSIIESHCAPQLETEKHMSPLRACLISNCLVFNVLGSTFTDSQSKTSNSPFPIASLSLLHDEEGNHCASIPSTLLMLLQAGSQLLAVNNQPEASRCSTTNAQFKPQDQALLILNQAYNFNPQVWASDLQQRSPTIDLADRTFIAQAHRAATCIYLTRVALAFQTNTELQQRLLQTLQPLASEALNHLSLIPTDNALFTATAWPTFVAGAETDDPEWQEWVTTRFRELWEVEPWGLIRGALEVLQGIWAERRAVKDVCRLEGTCDESVGSGNWVMELRSRGVHWLIL